MKVAEEIIKEKGSAMESVPPEATLAEALKKMVTKDIGSIVVMEKGTVIGIWSERELMCSIAFPGFDIHKEKVRDHMKKKVETIAHDEPVYRISDKLLGLKSRYLFVRKEDKIIGLLSSGDVIRACLIEKNEQLKSLGLEYYENWKHD